MRDEDNDMITIVMMTLHQGKACIYAFVVQRTTVMMMMMMDVHAYVLAAKHVVKSPHDVDKPNDSTRE